MSYLTVNDLRAYLNIEGSVDDGLLSTLVSAAQKAVESYTRRLFEATADTTRYFTVGVDTNGAMLYLDRDLCSITTLTNNADGTGEVLTTSHYTTVPRNETPYYAIKLLTSAGKYWRYTTSAENGITLAGRWAYSITPPLDIVQATRRLAGYYFKQRDAQVFDVTAMPDMGQILIPKGIPADVKQLLNPYIRAAL